MHKLLHTKHFKVRRTNIKTIYLDKFGIRFETHLQLTSNNKHKKATHQAKQTTITRPIFSQMCIYLHVFLPSYSFQTTLQKNKQTTNEFFFSLSFIWTFVSHAFVLLQHVHQHGYLFLKHCIFSLYV